MGGDMGIAFSIEVFQVVPYLSQVVHPNIDLMLRIGHRCGAVPDIYLGYEPAYEDLRA